MSSVNATSSTASSSLLRISGMASGIDTDSIVKSMLSSYQSRIDKANQAKQTLQWKQEAYRDTIKDIKGLQEYFDPLSSKYMLSGNSLNINTAASDDTSIVSATSGSTAKAGTYKVDVDQLATQAKIEGTSKDTLVKVTDLSNWSGKVLDFGSSGSITLSGITDTTMNSTNMSKLASDINQQIASNATLKGKISASYVNDGTHNYIKFTSTESITLDGTDVGGGTTVSDIGGSDLTINSGISSTSKLISDLGFSSGSIKFTLTNGSTNSTVSLTVDANTTVQNLIDQVNSSTNGAVTLNVDTTTGKFSFQSKNYGSSSNIKITNDSADNNIITELGISSTTGIGKDAIVSITEPGQTTATTTTQSSNKFTLNGVTYNLVGVNAAGDTSNVTVTGNSDTVVTNVKKFIEDYNSVISKINTKLTEKKNNDYQPLTDAQKESMSEDQITAWETKAKVGILRKDDYLSNLMTQLRGIFSSPVYSSYNSTDTSAGKVSISFGQYGTNAIGIDTSTDYTDGGKLVIKDETKLKNAIENNIEDFKKFFIGASTATLGDNEAYIGSKKYMEDGLFKRMDTMLRDYVAAPGLGEDGAYTLSGSMNIFVNKQYDYSTSGSSGKNTLPDQVYKQTLSISKIADQMSDAETRYYAKFTALETAMNNLNSQQAQLSSMLGTG